VAHLSPAGLLRRGAPDRGGAPGAQPGGMGVLLPVERARGRTRRLQPRCAPGVHAHQRRGGARVPAPRKPRAHLRRATTAAPFTRITIAEAIASTGTHNTDGNAPGPVLGPTST